MEIFQTLSGLRLLRALLPENDPLIPRVEMEIDRLQRLIEEQAEQRKRRVPAVDTDTLIREIKARGIDLRN